MSDPNNDANTWQTPGATAGRQAAALPRSPICCPISSIIWSWRSLVTGAGSWAASSASSSSAVKYTSSTRRNASALESKNIAVRYMSARERAG